MSIKYGITFHPSWWHKNAGIDFVQEFFDDPAYRIDCDLKMRKCLYDRFGSFGIGEENPSPRPLLGSDFLAAGYLQSELLGCEIKYEPDNSPQVISMGLNPGEIGRIKAADLDISPVWARTQKQIDWLLEKYGRVESYVNLMGIQNIAMDIMGQGLFLAYYTDEDAVRGLLGEIYKTVLAAGKRFKALTSDVSGGVTAIIRDVMPQCYLTSNCSVEMISNDQYEDFLLEHDQALADEFGCFGIHHCGGTMEHVTEGYRKVRGLAFAEVGAGSDLAAVRQAMPDMMLNARYSPAKLLTETEQQIRAKVQALCEAGRDYKDRGLISISCVGIDSNVPYESICTFLSACSEL